MATSTLLQGARRLDDGCTADQVALHRRPDGVFLLSLLASPANPENRWTLHFDRAVHAAFDAVEAALAADPRGTPAALLTVSDSPKFFSNGIDPKWVMSKDTPREELLEWEDLTMPAFARPILLPIPTLCAITGHAFGAGLMFALAHDYRLQQLDKGLLCAPEIAIGLNTPPPEFTLFWHSIPAGAFYETILHARRWGGADALRVGIVQAAVSGEKLLEEAVKTAAQHAKLGANRACMEYTKSQVKGQVAREILSHCFPGGKQRSSVAISKSLLGHVDRLVVKGKLDAAWGAAHLGGGPLVDPRSRL